MSTAAPSPAELRELIDKVDKMIGLLTGIAVRKESRHEQARRLGIHPATLYRREKKARMKLMLEGRV